MTYADKILLHYNNVVSYCNSLYRYDREKAKDLVQTVMMKAFANQAKDESNLKGWLLSIVHNEFINESKKNGKFKKVQLMECDKCNYQPNLFDTELIESLLMNHCELSDYMAGYKYEEIAEAKKTPLGTVKIRIHLSRKELKRIFM